MITIKTMKLRFFSYFITCFVQSPLCGYSMAGRRSATDPFGSEQVCSDLNGPQTGLLPELSKRTPRSLQANLNPRWTFVEEFTFRLQRTCSALRHGLYRTSIGTRYGSDWTLKSKAESVGVCIGSGGVRFENSGSGPVWSRFRSGTDPNGPKRVSGGSDRVRRRPTSGHKIAH